MRLSPDELSNFRLRFERLVVVLPSGLVVGFPENADLPSLDLEAPASTGSQIFDLHLAVPLWQSKRANAFEIGAPADSRSKLLYSNT